VGEKVPSEYGGPCEPDRHPGGDDTEPQLRRRQQQRNLGATAPSCTYDLRTLFQVKGERDGHLLWAMV